MKRPFQYLDKVIVKRALFLIAITFVCLVVVTGQNSGKVRASSSTNQVVYLPLVIKSSSPIPGQVSILPNHTYYNFHGTLYVLGEIQNNTDKAVDGIMAYANFFNNTGQLLDTGSGYAQTHSVPPGVKSCFYISLTEPTGWSYYQFEKPTYVTWLSNHTLPNITLASLTINSSSAYSMIGQVRNDAGVKVGATSIEATLYDSSGQVIDCGSTFPNNSTLDPGQVSAFKINFYRRSSYSVVATYRIQIDGYPQ